MGIGTASIFYFSFRYVALGFSLVVLALATSTAWADTKKVDVKANQAQWIDGIAAINGETCGSMVATPKIKVEPEHGRLELRQVPYKLDEGPCRGKTIKITGVGFVPNRGFRGTDKATVTWRQPRGNYYIGQELRLHTRTYEISIK